MGLHEAIESFAEGMKQASDLIIQKDPAYLICPMMGAVPFVDSMAAVNPDFNHNMAYYMPASSHVPDINNVIRDWMGNFLEENIDLERDNHIITIDEVVSGGSATRGHKQVGQEIKSYLQRKKSDYLSAFWATEPEEFKTAARRLDALTKHQNYQFFSELVNNQKKGLLQADKNKLNYAAKEVKKIADDYFDHLIRFEGIGIEDSKNGTYKQGKRKRNQPYTTMVDSGQITPIGVDAILTMDNPIMCPISYEIISPDKHQFHVKYRPIVIPEPVINEEYIMLLSQLKKHIQGTTEAKVVSVERAVGSSEYLSQHFGGHYSRH
jgi:hypothetical protein